MEYTLPPPFDYARQSPCVIRETPAWAVIYKPAGMPTAPLRPAETGTLVHWFLSSRPETQAAAVRGKKAIEAGLLHRLDTDTRGLVLFAKDQLTYDFFSAQQDTGGIVKTYYAFIESGAAAAAERITQQLPYTLQSQFRNFGPGAKKAAPVFPHSRHFTKDGRIYTTVIEAVTVTAGAIGVRCRLQRGYRHQVRTHLAALGLPIAGDPLYGSGKECNSDTAAHAEQGLQLYATDLSLPNPQNRFQRISVALPPPDRMTL